MPNLVLSSPLFTHSPFSSSPWLLNGKENKRHAVIRRSAVQSSNVSSKTNACSRCLGNCRRTAAATAVCPKTNCITAVLWPGINTLNLHSSGSSQWLKTLGLTNGLAWLKYKAILVLIMPRAVRFQDDNRGYVPSPRAALVSTLGLQFSWVSCNPAQLQQVGLKARYCNRLTVNPRNVGSAGQDAAGPLADGPLAQPSTGGAGHH